MTTIKKLHIAAWLLCVSASESIIATAIHLRNMTSEPIWVHLKASHKNKDKKTRHDETTILLHSAGYKNKKQEYGDRSSWGFTGGSEYNGTLQNMDIYNYDPAKQAPKNAKVGRFKEIFVNNNQGIAIEGINDDNKFTCLYRTDMMSLSINPSCKTNLNGNYRYKIAYVLSRTITTITPTANQTTPTVTVQVKNFDPKVKQSVSELKLSIDPKAELSLTYLDAQNKTITVGSSSVFKVANNKSHQIPAGAKKVKVTDSAKNENIFDIKDANTSYAITIEQETNKAWPRPTDRN